MSDMSTYHPHQAYAAPARFSADLPRLVIGLVAIEMCYGFAMGIVDSLLLSAPEDTANGFYNGTSRLGLLLQLSSFALLALAVILVTRFLHRRNALTLLGPLGPTLWGLRKATFACLSALIVIELMPPYFDFSVLSANNSLAWLSLLPVSMLALLIQTGAEELLYRGYLQQQLAARFSSAWVWMILPNLLFAGAHWNESVPHGEAVGYVIWAFFFGLAASDLTARTGNIGAAIGFHLANNAYVFLLFGEKDAVDSGLALLLYPSQQGLLPPSVEAAPFDPFGLIIELLILLIMWISARIAIKR